MPNFTNYQITFKRETPVINSSKPVHLELERNSCQENYEKTKKTGRAVKTRKIEDYEFKIKSEELSQLRWTQMENEKYLEFIKQNEVLFDTESLRRRAKVFTRMSKLMDGARTPNQCKSHHQKMKKYTQNGTLAEIMDYICEKYYNMKEKDTRTKDMNSNEFNYESLEDENNGQKLFVLDFEKSIEVRIYLSPNEMTKW